jgi:subtilisin family serine protease
MESLGWPYQAAGRELIGADVMVGVVDTIIDVTHPAIRDALLTVWHQGATSGGRPHTSGRGQVYGGDMLWAVDRSAPSMPGPRDHATDVAAIAAGRAPFSGLASNAELIAVVLEGCRSAAIDGVEWIFDVATQMGLPAVVNLSLGGDHFDPHDGTDRFSVALNRLAGPGRLIVAAAGNENHCALHAAMHLQPNEAQLLPLVCAHDPSQFPKIALFAHPRTALRVRLHRGSVLTTALEPVTDWVEPGYEEGQEIDGWRVHLASKGEHGAGEATCIMKRTQDARDDVSFWCLEVKSEGASTLVHVWSKSITAEFLAFDSPEGINGDLPDHASVSHDHMIAFPASASNVITVGGIELAPSGDHRICYFSNVGPTADQRAKPELVMKAQDIQAASPHAVKGTSFAAPMVTGVLAAALQVQPVLDPDGAREILAKACVPVSDNIASQLAWGSGTLNGPDLRKALQSLIEE